MSTSGEGAPSFPAGGFDALPPPAMARRAEETGVAKAALNTERLLVLAVLAGAFIAMGAVFATTVTAGSGELAFGVTRLLAGLTFSLGLILVVVAGAELFTGDNLIVMAWAARRVTTGRMLAIWGLPLRLLIAGPMIDRFGYAMTVFAYNALGLAATVVIAWRWREALWRRSAAANAA